MRRTLPWLLCATVLLAGCKPAADGGATPGAGPAPGPAATAPVPPPAEPAMAAKAKPTHPSLQVDTIDGSRYDLAAHRGKWVVVNFWATWCSPCLKEMPELSALDALREHVEVIGLAYEDITADAMRDFLRKHPVVYPIAILDTYQPPADFDTPRGLPMTYLIAPDGTIARRFMGPVTAHELEEAIEAGGGPAVEPQSPGSGDAA